MNQIRLKWWQLALLSIAVSTLGSLSAMQRSAKQRKAYRSLKQAPWAPPAWVFAPAWIFNNYFLLAALQELLRNREMPARKKLLVFQSFMWIVFFSFNYAYFKKRSPLLAGMLTLSDAAFALSSLIIGFKAKNKVAANYIPLSIWTVFASTLAVYQALRNEDPLFKTPALENIT